MRNVVVSTLTSLDGYHEGPGQDVADDETQPPVERAISERNNAIEKVVVSDTLTLDADAPWSATTRVVGRADPSTWSPS